MKAQNTFKMVLLTVALSITSGAMAQSCYLENDSRVRVGDQTTESKKKLWNACIDKQLAYLDPSHPNYMELGQQVGDSCVNARIICE